LFDNHQYDLLHFLLLVVELAFQCRHHFFSVLLGMLHVHQRDDVSDSFQECSKTFPTMLVDAFPQRDQHRIECLNPVRC
jgi:hypothetical protein